MDVPGTPAHLQVHPGGLADTELPQGHPLSQPINDHGYPHMVAIDPAAYQSVVPYAYAADVNGNPLAAHVLHHAADMPTHDLAASAAMVAAHQHQAQQQQQHEYQHEPHHEHHHHGEHHPHEHEQHVHEHHHAMGQHHEHLLTHAPEHLLQHHAHEQHHHHQTEQAHMQQQVHQHLAAAAAAAVSGGPDQQQQQQQLESARTSENGSAASGSQSEKNSMNRAAITAQVELMIRPNIDAMDLDHLQNWLADLKGQSSHCTREFEASRNWLKQVEAERTRARDAYRTDQRSSARQTSWKEQVALGKQAQEQLRNCKEASYRASAAVDIVDIEIKKRAGVAAGSRTIGSGPSAKRKRTHTPQEACPYCDHSYTVRDGLSTKTDAEGNKLHLRKCQCRKKTPPCKNCPHCRDNPDLMSLSDPLVQQQYCESHIKCPICACNCPGSGKWIEGDQHSRQYYWARTNRRKDTLSRLGWHMSSPIVPPTIPYNPMDHPMRDQPPQPSSALHPHAQGGPPGSQGATPAEGDSAAQLASTGSGGVYSIRGEDGRVVAPNGALPPPLPPLAEGCHTHGGLSERQVRQIKRLPADIRAQVHALQGVTTPLNSAVKEATTPQQTPGKRDGQAHRQDAVHGSGDIQYTPVPELPAEVDGLVRECFEAAAGEGAVIAVAHFLRQQRVTTLVDLQFLQLPWLQEALGPLGLPPLLLNKFLSLAHQRMGLPSPPMPEPDDAQAA